MSLESFIKDMPKVELDVLLEGSLRPDTLRIIAEQNDIPTTFKQYQQWMEVFVHPEFNKMEPLLQTIANWFQQPDDLTRVVYDLGVSLAKQNVRYAEIGFVPTLYNNMTFDQILTAINDGRNRVERGWNVRMSWILQLPRNQIRRIDDVIRWATSTSARNSGIVGIGLMGRDDLPPAEDFERPFHNARKKGVGCTVAAGDSRGGPGILAAIDHLEPMRIVTSWGVSESPDVLKSLRDKSIGLVIQVAQALALKQISDVKQYPISGLLEKQVPIIIGTGMPTYFNTSLTEEYLTLVSKTNIGADSIRQMNLNAIRYSMLDLDEKQHLINEFDTAFERLR